MTHVLTYVTIIFLHLHKPPNAHLPAMQENREFHEDDIENSYYLLCIFDAIMNTMTKANGKKVSMFGV